MGTRRQFLRAIAGIAAGLALRGVPLDMEGLAARFVENFIREVYSRGTMPILTGGPPGRPIRIDSPQSISFPRFQ